MGQFDTAIETLLFKYGLCLDRCHYLVLAEIWRTASATLAAPSFATFSINALAPVPIAKSVMEDSVMAAMDQRWVRIGGDDEKVDDSLHPPSPLYIYIYI